MKQLWPPLGLAAVALGAGVLLGACQKEKPPAPAPAAEPPASVAQVQPAPPPQPPKPEVKPLEWQDPPQWKKLEAKGMRVASYEIPAAKGDKEGGELNVFILGGEIEPNIQRWVNEFSGMKLDTVVRKDRTVNDTRQAIVEVPKGKFNGGMGDKGERDNYGLLGGIVVAPSGAQYFFKLTAPANTINAAKKPFYAMLDSIREIGSAPTADATGSAPPTAVTPGSAQAAKHATPAAPPPAKH